MGLLLCPPSTILYTAESYSGFSGRAFFRYKDEGILVKSSVFLSDSKNAQVQLPCSRFLDRTSHRTCQNNSVTIDVDFLLRFLSIICSANHICFGTSGRAFV